jgi:hypothetical protein
VRLLRTANAKGIRCPNISMATAHLHFNTSAAWGLKASSPSAGSAVPVGALCGLDQSQEPGRAGCNEADRMNPKHPPGPPINDDPALESDSTGQEAPIAGNERAKHETVDQGGVPTHPLSDRDMTRTSRQTHYGEVNDDSTLEKEADVMGRKAAALRTR